MLIAIEGIDGSGKGTQAQRLTAQLQAQGRTACLISFPRYTETFFGRAVGQFLNGQFGSLAEANPFLVSLLFAGDRFESRDLLQTALAEHEFVILDRYVGSNIAHQGAKLPLERRGDLIAWVQEVEFGVYGLPRADRNLLLDLPAETAQELVGRKQARDYTDQSHDLQEADRDYLAAVRSMYLELAEARADWEIVECLTDGDLRSIDAIGDEILARVLQAAES